MNPKVFDFKEQLNVGNEGEKDFCIFYKNLQPQKSQDIRIDFILKDGSTVELKTDSYPMSQTPNYFMEMFGNIDSGALGGPWRALQDNVTYFVYYFKKDKTFFWFKTEKLCDELDKIISKNKLNIINIMNKGWEARGYKIPRESLSRVEYRKDIF